ncbi:conserved protein of unknown function [Georgfuchsia toluolica]|uniref:Uncharacterized protein n=1 Tax=Georgfuchsia toluolica TaxID=424218 RepID=A0A916J269_9PROT|nr:hypothetical protein [Georgfuchsia toluolica]CAG4882792.1 conserved protein of unknown function [Georgfuchsia toluolica]
MSATGAIFEGRCLSSNAEAVDAYYSKAAPVLVPGSTSYLNQFVKDAGVWYQKSYSIDGSGTQTLRYSIAAPSITFDSCDMTEPFFDGLSVGWMIAAAMVAAAAVMFMRRGL